MNCPTRDPDPSGHATFNQTPAALDNDLVTNRSTNTLTNAGSRPSTGMASLLDDPGVGIGAPGAVYDAEPAVARAAHAGADVSFAPARRTATDDSFALSDKAYDAYSTSRGISDDGASIYEMTPYKNAAAPAGFPSAHAATTGIGGKDYDVSAVNRSAFADARAVTPGTFSPVSSANYPYGSGSSHDSSVHYKVGWRERAKAVLVKYSSFIGPGLMISVAYIDPGNYSTDVAAGALFRFKLLFVVFLSNIIAMFLQCLAAKLGSVTGMDLAQVCRAHCPRWLCLVLYVLAEAAIIATDLAEVVGTAISLKILFNIPLVAGVAITMVDVIIVLMAYRPNGQVKFVRYFEFAVATLVFGVVICFCVELGHIRNTSPGEVFRGFVPSHEIFTSQGLYYSCGILGATVMPHSLFLGSGLVQARLREFDEAHGFYIRNDSLDDIKYRPSVQAIKHALSYSMVELCLSLFTFALFVNCSILIVSGAALSGTPAAADADLFSIHDMLASTLSKAAGTIFALALLFSGQSAGIVCTLAGQMVSEGFLHWTFKPWIRRLITRSIAVLPCIAVAGAMGRTGIADVLNWSQVLLSILLPIVSAPLIYFTSFKKYMSVPVLTEPDTPEEPGSFESDDRRDMEYVDMSNGPIATVTGVIIWCFIAGLNMYLIVLMAEGKDY
ncbi:natural resistance-associated macrophage protein-domain-containing protein [Dipodascopsis tothii]|uniref:natural resistance-associated macrophage protein-domain-containing protein n=1 Tax=Dipodascopsis tothii TaxID=44089 RepID=UPI0034CEBB02